MAFNPLGWLTGGQSPSPTPLNADPDFADFATAASPSPTPAISDIFTAATHTAPADIGRGFFNSPYGIPGRPYTKWYRVWERTSVTDFYQEMIIIPILLIVVAINFWGSRRNVRKVRAWAEMYLPLVEREFASVGLEGKSDQGVKETLEASSGALPASLLKQLKKNEYLTYATGRQNVAFLDVKLTLFKRYNPFVWLVESGLSFFFDSIPAPKESMEASLYCFDGREKSMAPNATGSTGNSTYDGFVWGVVHKDSMKRLRDERYDLSLTATRDHAKLPDWATVMSENAEVTEALLTEQLVQAIQQLGESLDSLIISDLPVDAPKKLNDLQPRKRITLTLSPMPPPNPNPTNSVPTLFTYFLTLPDVLVQHAHFRPEVSRKLRATRDEEMRKLRKIDDDEKAEERKAAGDKAKKEERERRLNGMSAEEQRKFLEREAEQERKRDMKKRSVRG